MRRYSLALGRLASRATAGCTARAGPAVPLVAAFSTAAASTPAAAAAAAPVDASSLPPLSRGSFRVVVREVRLSRADWCLTRGPERPDSAAFAEALATRTPPRPSTLTLGVAASGEPAPRTSHAARSRVFKWLMDRFGLERNLAAGRLLQSIHDQALRDEWYDWYGMERTITARIQMNALHLWLLHVRLRTEPNDEDMRQITRILFDQFWTEQRHLIEGHYAADPTADAKGFQRGGSHVPPGWSLDWSMTQLTQTIYGGWVAMDHALPSVINAEEQHSASGASTFQQRPSAAYDSLISDVQAPDLAMLGALWRNVYLGDRQLNPHHLPHLLEYIVRMIEHLYKYSSTDILAGRFRWLPPPRRLVPPVRSGYEWERVHAYYEFLAPPSHRSRAVVTKEGLRATTTTERMPMSMRDGKKDDGTNKYK